MRGEQARRRGRWPVAALAALAVVSLAPVAGADQGALAATVAVGAPAQDLELAPIDVASYDPSLPLNARHTLTVSAASGTYALTYRGATTAPILRGATAAQVQAALQALATVDHDGVPGADVVVTGGVGAGSGGRHYRISFTDPLEPGDAFGRLTATDLTLAGGADQVVVRCDRCADVYRPAAEPPVGGRPAVVLVHGGGFTGGAKDAESGDANGARMPRWASGLAAQGFVAVPISYTLEDPVDLAAAVCDWDALVAAPCPSSWMDALTVARHDAQAAVRWLRWSALPIEQGGLGNPYGIDPDRIAIAGESAGAMVALATLYRSDDPGAVGITGPSSTVAAAVSVAGLTVDAWQDAGEGPALLMVSTNDPVADLWGSDFYEEAREVLARGRAVGNDVQLFSWCTRYDQNDDGVDDPVHLFRLDRPELDQQIGRAAAFLHEQLEAPPAGPGVRWLGATRHDVVVTGPGQTMFGDLEPIVGDFDGDGFDDIVWLGAGAGCDTIWWGAADGTFSDPDESTGFVFTPAIDLPVGGGVAVGDFDGDGADDLWVATAPVLGEYRVLTTAGTRSFGASAVAGLDAELDFHAGDVDGDGHDDMVLVWSEGGYALVGYGGLTPMGFEDIELLGVPVGIDVALADIDGDGRHDLVGTGSDAGIVAYGQPRTAAAALDVRTVDQLRGPGAPVVLDADGDGFDDVLVHVDGGWSRLTYGSATRGVLDAGRSWVVGPGTVPRAGDLDGDGRGDLVWHNPASGTGGQVWFGTAARTLLPFVVASMPAMATGWQPVTLDMDGQVSPSGLPRTDLLWYPGG